jgi:hypothetical protein
VAIDLVYSDALQELREGTSTTDDNISDPEVAEEIHGKKPQELEHAR